nr:transcription termination factor MTERF5, chloroplastic-like [Tanacetum cinerariifolium]
MKKTHWPFYGKFFKSNVVLLKKYGVGFKDIEKIIIRNPRLVTQNPVRLEDKVLELEKEFGIKPGSAMFSYGLSALCSMNELNLKKKFELFRKFGWCDLDVCVIARSQPICFTHSEERLSKMLDFYMNELEFGSSWLACRGSILMYSLEKRVKPRFWSGIKKQCLIIYMTVLSRT